MRDLLESAEGDAAISKAVMAAHKIPPIYAWDAMTVALDSKGSVRSFLKLADETPSLRRYSPSKLKAIFKTIKDSGYIS